MSNRLIVADARAVALPNELDAGEEIVSGTPAASHLPLEPLGGVAIGLWEITPGAMRDVEADEVFVVLSGRGTIEFEHGETVHLAPGTVVRLEAGDKTAWTITETMRKLYLAR